MNLQEQVNIIFPNNLDWLDEKIIRIALKKDIQYLRYVDDIVLMGKNRQLVEKSLIQLDIAARELSLIPQSGKILVKKINNIDEILKANNSLFEFLELGDFDKNRVGQKSLKSLNSRLNKFLRCLNLLFFA